MIKKKKVAILLSTYNGEKFIRNFIDSILSQTYKDFILFVRDDGSIDGTMHIINQYADRYCNVELLRSSGNKGSMQSFSDLSEYVSSNYDFAYYMFADQDDVWLPGKIQCSLDKMEDMIREHGNIPLLVHTDLKVVDRDLNLISKSFWKYQHINPDLDGLNRLIMQNIVTGCTILFNRELAQISFPIPNGAIMHDWWLALVASAFGKIDYIHEPTILYRQHPKNALGAKKFNLIYFINKMMMPISLEKNIIQSKNFYEMFSSKLHLHQRESLLSFLKLSSEVYYIKILIFIKFKFYKNGIIRNIGLFLKIR